jgi:hypothetical protein
MSCGTTGLLEKSDCTPSLSVYAASRRRFNPLISQEQPRSSQGAEWSSLSQNGRRLLCDTSICQCLYPCIYLCFMDTGLGCSAAVRTTSSCRAALCVRRVGSGEAAPQAGQKGSMTCLRNLCCIAPPRTFSGVAGWERDRLGRIASRSNDAGETPALPDRASARRKLSSLTPHWCWAPFVLEGVGAWHGVPLRKNAPAAVPATSNVT